MSIWNAILQGIIQGLTEFLPVSSSGHLAVYQHFAGVGKEMAPLFTVLLHLGTLLAVFIVYYKTIWNLMVEAAATVRDLFTRRFSFRHMNENRRMLLMLIVSCVPLLFLLIPVGKGNRLMDVLGGLATNMFAVGLCFLFTAALLLYGSWMSSHRSKFHKINTTDAVAVGLAQMLAAGFAGVSRSGSTISAGMACGVKKEYMVKYSFILGIPAILAANLVELKEAFAVQTKIEILPVLIGVLVAMAVGVFAIKALQWLVAKDHFKIFGYYCAVLGVVVAGIGIWDWAAK